MNVLDIMIILIILAAVVPAILHIIKSRKNGCGCGCGGCGKSCCKSGCTVNDITQEKRND